MLYKSQHRYTEAEPLLQRALASMEKALGRDHSEVAISQNNLAMLYYQQGKYEQAAEPFEHIITNLQHALPGHPALAKAMENYALILRKLDRMDEAAQWSASAAAIRAKRASRTQAAAPTEDTPEYRQ